MWKRGFLTVGCGAMLGVFVAQEVFAGPLEVFRDCDVCPEMIELPLGEFMMGAPEDEFRSNLVLYDGVFQPATSEHPYLKQDEGPQHVVSVDIPIAMARNEVTVDEWMVCVADGGCGGYVPELAIGRMGPIDAIVRSLSEEDFTQSPSGKARAEAMAGNDFLTINGNYPILYVSYIDAQAYISWLNKKIGTDAYRLPTEAEWEYAARAGMQTRFAQGDELTSTQANFSGWETERSLLEKRPDLLTRGFPVPVDELDAANRWGLRHMSGNAGEITLSCYMERYAGWTTTSEWLARSFGQNCERVVRGGGFAFEMGIARVAWRASVDQTSQTKFDGFRIVRELN
jgi:formylglycine-generating enzyme required for sulfatase activity